MSEPEPGTRKPSARHVAAAVAALVPLAVIVIALLMGGGGGSATGRTHPANTSAFVPAASNQASATQASAPQTSSTASTSPAPRSELPGGSGAVVAQLAHPTELRARPGGRVVARLSTKTAFGSAVVLWVTRYSGRWLGVVTPQAGNNHVGWIQASAASLSRVTWEVRVSLSARKVTVLDHGHVAQRYTVAIGAPDSPTPTGRFAVTDRLLTDNPASPYGCCILALSATAPHAIQGWSGGNRIAIHSTPETSTIGEAVSHGCLRLTLAEGRWLVDHVPLGTPTLISS